VLLVEDEPTIRAPLRRFLERNALGVDEADSWSAALESCRRAPPDAAVVDFRLADGTALDLLAGLRAAHLQVPVVVLTGHGTVEMAVQAMRLGARHFLTKPVQLSALWVVLEELLGGARAPTQVEERPRSGGGPDPFLGTSAAIRHLEAVARKVLQSPSPVLILGETGTGKGVLARWLHEHGPRGGKPFVNINCAGLSREFLESELFGHERGAFTGAVTAKPGLLEVAHGGTLFLDEVGDMEAAVQPKLLKVLEERTFRRLGEVRDRAVDVHLVAATHQSFAALVAEGRFRRDLYFRISTIPLVLPPLRERPDDVPVLAAELLRQFAGRLGRPPATLSPAALRALQAHPWPGNLRELRNVLERAVLLSDGGVLEPRDLHFEPGLMVVPAALPPPAPPLPGDGLPPTHLTLAEVERLHIERVLAEEGGRVEQAARRLGIPRSSLYDKLRKLRGPGGEE
jgi:DNA-binding NtrC family response regulator